MGKKHSAKGKKKCYTKKAHGTAPKTKHLGKGYDQIFDEYHSSKPKKLVRDLDLPGEGQFYCTACSSYYIDEIALKDHSGTKRHKRQFV